MSNLSFAEITNIDRPTYTLSSGEEITFRVQADFNAVDAARAQSLGDKIQKTGKALASRPDDEQVAARYDALYGDFVKLLLPDLPDQELGLLTTGMRVQIVQWWNRQQPEAVVPNGSAPAG